MASVLKSESATEKISAARSVSGLAGFNLNDLADEGRTRLDQCRSQIREMISDASAEAASIRQQAEANGYEEGLRRASVDAETKLRREADERAKEGLRLIGQAVQHLHRTHEQWMQEYSQQLSCIALACAERVIRRKLEDEPEILVRWAEEAIASTRTATSLTLAVHPETLAEVGDSLDTILASPGIPEKTHVEPDESLARDAVVVRQLGGDIQAGLEAQLERLGELLS